MLLYGLIFSLSPFSRVQWCQQFMAEFWYDWVVPMLYQLLNILSITLVYCNYYILSICI